MNRLRSKIDLKAERLGWLEDDLRAAGYLDTEEKVREARRALEEAADILDHEHDRLTSDVGSAEWRNR